MQGIGSAFAHTACSKHSTQHSVNREQACIGWIQLRATLIAQMIQPTSVWQPQMTLHHPCTSSSDVLGGSWPQSWPCLVRGSSLWLQLARGAALLQPTGSLIVCQLPWRPRHNDLCTALTCHTAAARLPLRRSACLSCSRPRAANPPRHCCSRFCCYCCQQASLQMQRR